LYAPLVSQQDFDDKESLVVVVTTALCAANPPVDGIICKRMAAHDDGIGPRVARDVESCDIRKT
jgi:hypothetical protein